MYSIDASIEDLDTITCKAWKALHELNKREERLFVFEGKLCILEKDDRNKVFPRIVGEVEMRRLLCQAAEWYVTRNSNDGPKKEKKFPKIEIIRDMIAHPSELIPRLKRIVFAPIFDKDGLLCDKPGYNKSANVYYHEVQKIEPISEYPTVEEAKKAREFVLRPFADFPFVDAASRTHALCGLFLPYVRNMINGPTPLHVIDAPSVGTGKTFLGEIMTCSSLNSKPGSTEVVKEPFDDDEFKKQLITYAKDMRQVLFIDNVLGTLRSPTLAMHLTQTCISGRLLGSNTSIHADFYWTWIATGNNIRVNDDVARRSVHIRIDAKQEDPYLEREFSIPDLRTWIVENRQEFIYAILTLIRFGLQHGSYSGKKIGMFEAWSDVMGTILNGINVKGFLDNFKEFAARSNEEKDMWTAFVEAWRITHGKSEVSVAQIFPLIAGNDIPFKLHGINDLAQKKSFAILLEKKKDAVFNGCRIVKCNKSRGYQFWKLELDEENTKKVEEHQAKEKKLTQGQRFMRDMQMECGLARPIKDSIPEQQCETVTNAIQPAKSNEEQDDASSQKIESDPLTNLEQNSHEEISSTNVPQNIVEKIDDNNDKAFKVDDLWAYFSNEYHAVRDYFVEGDEATYTVLVLSGDSLEEIKREVRAFFDEVRQRSPESHIETVQEQHSAPVKKEVIPEPTFTEEEQKKKDEEIEWLLAGIPDEDTPPLTEEDEEPEVILAGS
jgi:hypothetical protein